MTKGPQGRPRATFENTDKVFNKIKDQKKSKIKQAMTSDAAYRVEAKNGGSMNHQQLTGWGDVRTDVKKFGKK